MESEYGGVEGVKPEEYAGVVVYTPEQARVQLDSDAIQRLRSRFIDAMGEGYGARDMDVSLSPARGCHLRL